MGILIPEFGSKKETIVKGLNAIPLQCQFQEFYSRCLATIKE
jgi:hypothetical protein